MEEIKKKNYHNYNKINSPIFNYYSDYINHSNPEYNSEISQFKKSNFSGIYQNHNPEQKFEKIELKFNNEFLKKDNKEPYKNNNSESNKINIKKETEVNSINNINLEKEQNFEKPKNNNIIIRAINENDLIPTSINGHTILRINPLIYKNESYEFLSYNLYMLLKDQLGCKFLQEKLETDTQKAVSYFYPSLLHNLLFLIKDSFANYFIQKICHFLNEEQIENILNVLKPEFKDICYDNHGTRSIQGIMNNLQTEKLRNIFFEIIKPIFIYLIYDTNSSHIIYKFINEFQDFLSRVNSIVLDNCLNLSTHKKGCFFIQNYLIILNNVKSNFKENLINNILNNCLILIIDKIGNYLIQYLLTLGDENITSEIINKIINNISFYSKHKYSNFVIEKIFIYANKYDNNRIITKLASPEIMSDLIFDQQGNYIILKALMFADEEKRNIMLNIIGNLEPKIKKSSNGKNFLNKVYNSKFTNKNQNYKPFNSLKKNDNKK